MVVARRRESTIRSASRSRPARQRDRALHNVSRRSTGAEAGRAAAGRGAQTLPGPAPAKKTAHALHLMAGSRLPRQGSLTVGVTPAAVRMAPMATEAAVPRIAPRVRCGDLATSGGRSAAGTGAVGAMAGRGAGLPHPLLFLERAPSIDTGGRRGVAPHPAESPSCG
jgi:hypothetical protein